METMIGLIQQNTMAGISIQFPLLGTDVEEDMMMRSTETKE
jgi:hypothetical protein